MARKKEDNMVKTIFNTERSNKIYSNRFKLDIGDEEIVLTFGVRNDDKHEVDVLSEVYLTLPGLLRLYDEIDSAVTNLYSKKENYKG